MSNAPSKPVSFSRPKVGYFSNRPRIPLLCVQWKSPDDGQRKSPKHVEFYAKINLRN